MRSINTIIAFPVVVVSLVVVTLMEAPAQTPRTGDEKDVVFRATTDLVEVHVVVRDKQGQAVTDLRKEDFEVFENGKPQPITLFASEKDGAADPPWSPANTFSNQIVAREPGGYAVILLDWLNTGWVDQAQARRQVIEMLSQIRLEEKVALFVLGRGLRVVHDFTSNTAQLLDNLTPLRGHVAIGREDQVSSIWDASKKGFEGDLFGDPSLLTRAPFQGLAEKIHFLDLRVHDTLAAFEQIAAHLAGVPGRKSLIWLSAGFPMVIDSTVIPGASPGERSYSAEIERAIHKFNDADVAVYPVDARGLTGGSLSRITIATMKEFASRTGGVAFYNRNDLESGLRAGLDDLHGGYTLGYSLPDTGRKGFRRIRVRVSRPGLRLRYRRGYYAGEPAESTSNQRQGALMHALLSPVDFTSIPITVRVRRSAGILELTVILHPTTVTINSHGERWKGGLDLVARFTADDGSQTGPVSTRVMEIDMPEKALDELMERGRLSLLVAYEVPFDATRLRILVQDHGSGTIGTVTIGNLAAF